MKTYGLIGKSLSHSFSPSYFADKFKTENIVDTTYKAFELAEINELPQLLKLPNLQGLNITIPYKKAALAYADVLSDTVKNIGACNTFKKLKNGQWKAYNTDADGFEKSFSPMLEPQHQKALILGNGGAALAVKHVLQKLNIPFLTVSRKPNVKGHIAYADVNQSLLTEYLVMINTTPLGTFPDLESYPDIPYQYLTPQHYLYDLVYNPKISTFLMKGKRQGTVIKNGLEMLHLQAQISWEIWNKS